MKKFLFVRSALHGICLAIALFTACQKPANSAHATDTSSPAISADVKEYLISPAETDPAITSHLDEHFASVTERSARTDVLFVFLPGSYRNPTVCRAITRKAASMGHHAIGLMYPNRKMINPLCADTDDITCHQRARLEVVDGIDRHLAVSVDQPNSIINRLQKLLMHLHKKYPQQNWGQYLKDGEINWGRVIIGGHSQGAACAGVIGKHYPVRKVVMLSMADYLSNGKVPDWLMLPRNSDKYYFLTNAKDELVPFDIQQSAWQQMNATRFGPPVALETSLPPYGASHILVSNAKPEVPATYIDKYHNSTAVDLYIPKTPSGKYIYDQAWEYLLSK